ncbi:hypothetical protein AVEN_165823-1 [Araneus ventricosus]|uniref:Ionotropic glutamate receptor L-glutamate and glycine-binding domain-containing protein n=1 Tax=Araneus ventricosus TaxID=182803 RepID=A0A4Y2EQL9_ARAVE|nr:hypothetical protein AVEN_165823-1 [Araneus ventricosus]
MSIVFLPFPHVLSVNAYENGAVEFGEFEGKFLQVVLDVLGTDYNTVVPKDMSFGSLLTSGSWTGMVGMAQRGEADLAFTYPSVTEERMKAIHQKSFDLSSSPKQERNPYENCKHRWKQRKYGKIFYESSTNTICRTLRVENSSFLSGNVRSGCNGVQCSIGPEGHSGKKNSRLPELME